MARCGGYALSIIYGPFCCVTRYCSSKSSVYFFWSRAVAALHQGAPGRSTALTPALAPPCLLLCFASVIVWTENKNFTISDQFICFILTVKQSQRRWGLHVLRATIKKARQLFLHPGDLARGCSNFEMT